MKNILTAPTIIMSFSKIVGQKADSKNVMPKMIGADILFFKK